MSNAGLPFDDDAEHAFVACCLLWPTATIMDAIDYVAPEDLFRPALSAMYRASIAVHLSGVAVDAISVSAELKKMGFEEVSIADVAHVIAYEGSGASWRRYADIIIDHSLRRRLITSGISIMEQAKDLTVSAIEILESHRSNLLTMDTAMVAREPDDIAVEDFLNRDRDLIAPWVVHGLIRRSHKIMLVAAEGLGKSWLLRFIAICAAYGIQPFRHERIKPVRTLIVDLENPEDALFDSFEAILKQVVAESGEMETVNRLWWRPAGINLRNRTDFAELENVIRARQPDLVCLGPLYAAYENSAKDFGWETATREVQQAFRRLRRRYDFALMIEDHAPQADGQGKRHIRPYGSSFWLRWPELGLGLEAIDEDDSNMAVTRWRGDRIVTDWPKRIYRGDSVGSPWPFLGDWTYKPEGKQRGKERTYEEDHRSGRD